MFNIIKSDITFIYFFKLFFKKGKYVREILGIDSPNKKK